MKKHPIIKCSPLSLLGLLGLALFASPVAAQVFDLGPSDPALFDTVINLPTDPNIVGTNQSIGGGDLLIQLNVSDLGSVGPRFEVNNRSELNISGGNVSFDLTANGGSEVNISGGTVSAGFMANANSTVNISGGAVFVQFNANADSTVNISGGSILRFFRANSGSEVNISGGTIDSNFEAFSGSVVNISGGNIDEAFIANVGSAVNFSGGQIGRDFEANGTINISGGSVSDFASANDGSTVNISGGVVGFGFEAFSGSEVTISGGTVGRNFDAQSGSDVELVGGEFQLNGTAISGTSISLSTGDTFTGTLSDGSVFIFSTEADDSLSNVQLSTVALPTLDLSTIEVSTSNPDSPSGLRGGQSLILLDGGDLGFNFEMAGATLDIEGGTLGNLATAHNSTVNISEGSIGDFFDVLSGSEVNISGGSVGQGFDARPGSVVNISGGSVDVGLQAFSDSVVNISGGSVGVGFQAFSGSEINLFGNNFAIDGVPLDSLSLNESMTIADRDGILSGLLSDGSLLNFDLSSDFIVDAGATLTLTRVVTQPRRISHVPQLTFDVDFGDAPGLDTPGVAVSTITVDDAGDVNGDGSPDWVVGAQRRMNTSDGELVFGKVTVLSGADGNVIYNFDSDSVEGVVGSAVSGAGDVNGDGFDDLILAAEDGIDGRDSVQVFSGLDASILFYFGSRGNTVVSGAGDVNGDGLADLIVGSSETDSFYGSAGVGLLSGLNGTSIRSFDFSVGGPVDGTSGRGFPSSVSSVGDVNGDGLDDVVVITTGTSAQVFSSTTSIYPLLRLPNTLGGSSVSGAGDVNGDGVPDIIVGVARNPGNAQVFSGSGGGLLYDFQGDLEELLGTSVSGGGDVDGDGFDDLIVGSPSFDRGAPTPGSVRVFSGSSGRLLYRFDGDSDSDEFGISVSHVGDVNGDGLADFVVGARGGATAADDAPYARLFVSQIGALFVLGDANQDGEVTFDDISPFIQLLLDGTFLEEADCNLDGVVDFADIEWFIDILTNA